MKKTLLTSTVSVDDYSRLKKRGDTKALAKLVYDRFFERFVEPFENNPSKVPFYLLSCFW